MAEIIKPEQVQSFTESLKVIFDNCCEEMENLKQLDNGRSFSRYAVDRKKAVKDSMTIVNTGLSIASKLKGIFGDDGDDVSVSAATAREIAEFEKRAAKKIK